MLNKKVSDLLNEQINKELYSAYLYLEMNNYFDKRGLNGFANWYMIQAQEERDHAMLIYKYMQNNDCPIKLNAIAQPDKVFKKDMDVLKAGLEHEEYVTASIHTIYDAAYKVKVTGNEKGLAYEGVPAGMWDMDRYVELLMGDAQRLQDTPDGYGPKGKNFIAHVNMPFEVKEAFRYLQKFYGVRKANPAYAKP